MQNADVLRRRPWGAGGGGVVGAGRDGVHRASVTARHESEKNHALLLSGTAVPCPPCWGFLPQLTSCTVHSLEGLAVAVEGQGALEEVCCGRPPGVLLVLVIAGVTRADAPAGAAPVAGVLGAAVLRGLAGAVDEPGCDARDGRGPGLLATESAGGRCWALNCTAWISTTTLLTGPARPVRQHCCVSKEHHTWPFTVHKQAHSDDAHVSQQPSGRQTQREQQLSISLT